MLSKHLYDYTKAFKILGQAVEETNYTKVGKIDHLESKSFEHQEKTDNSTKKDALCLKRPNWLPR